MVDFRWVSVLLFLLIAIDPTTQQQDEQQQSDSLFYQLYARDISTNKDVWLNKYRGKVVLIVNVASECGYTNSNYKQLVQMYHKYNARGLEILGFPCNQFGKQEPKKNKYVAKFAREKFSVPFDLFGKIHVVGENRHALYRWLKESTGGLEPSWNFCKYLLNGEGEVVRFASAWIPPIELEGDVETLLQGGRLDGGFLYHDHRQQQQQQQQQQREL